MQTSNRRIWLGIILIALGSLFFLDNFNFIWFDLRHTIFSWHTIFLIIGIVILINHKNSLAGYIFLIIGLFGTARHFIPVLFDFDFGDLWPILLLVIGLWLVLKKREPVRTSNFQYHVNNMKSQGSVFSQDILEEVCVFSSCNKIIHSENFQGGRIETIFGGTKLDLTNVKLAPGENTLEVTTIFGGCELRVPQGWKVLVNVTSVFGGFDDKRFTTFDPAQSSEGILVIKGVAIFGGGELLY